MKRLLIVTTLLIIGGALPVSAEQQLTSDQKREAEQMIQKWADTLNRGDQQSYRAMFTKGGLAIGPFGAAYGDSIGSDNERFRKMGGKLDARFERAEPTADGGEVIAVGSYRVTYTDNPATREATGNVMQVLEKEAGQWKIKALAAAREVKPPQ